MRGGGGFSQFFPTSVWAFRLAIGVIIGSVLNALLTKSGQGSWLPLFPELEQAELLRVVKAVRAAAKSRSTQPVLL